MYGGDGIKKRPGLDDPVFQPEVWHTAEFTDVVCEVLWSSVFVTLVAKKYRFMQFELDMVFDSY